MVTVDYDGVLTKLMIILMIVLGIWVIQACANFIWYIQYTVYGIYMVYTGCSIKLVLLEKF